MMWEYFVILFLSIIDMVKATTPFTMYESSLILTTKSRLHYGVNMWCAGGTDRNEIETARPSGCATSINIDCYGPIAGKQSFTQLI